MAGCFDWVDSGGGWRGAEVDSTPFIIGSNNVRRDGSSVVVLLDAVHCGGATDWLDSKESALASGGHDNESKMSGCSSSAGNVNGLVKVWNSFWLVLFRSLNSRIEHISIRHSIGGRARRMS